MFLHRIKLLEYCLHQDFSIFSLLQNRPLFQTICPGSLWARDNRWLLSRIQRLAGPAGGQRPFVPVGDTNREQRPLFCPGWWLQPGQKAARTFSPGWSYQPGLKVPFSPGSTLHPGQNGSRGHLSSYFTTAPHPLSHPYHFLFFDIFPPAKLP